ncbi:hypothetical protein POTOM_041989 [Populus tomentosa]|uniref:Methyltransferase n=1 Tax=Populus tomentosa TaxID=118781 RepID=A0A8X8C9M1_POPTO|nr:hypothetical protein POTOM_041989 [Populus tomentosa]
MATKGNSGDRKSNNSLLSIFVIAGLCGFFYILGAWQRSGFGKGDNIALEISKQTDCSVFNNLNYQKSGDAGMIDDGEQVKEFKPCEDKYIDYTPCQDQMRAMTFPRDNMIYRERHCPPDSKKLPCLIPAPKGYANPFPWPKSRDYVPFVNAPYKSLTVEKAVQNWIQYEGNVFRFPGGGTQFPHGADAYINELASVIPMDNGIVRTALDTGCGVASWGAYLFKKNVIAMSFAPRDSHESQIQFALERGVPAVIGVLGTIKLPYPSRAFDMAHCSRCLIPWGANDGMYMMEIDRVLRPGGYWVLSGPPINWKNNYQAWQRPKEELEEEQRKIEDVAKLLCWEKKLEIGEIAIWQKRINNDFCREQDPKRTICKSTNPDDVWYKKMEACVTPHPETDEVTGAAWQPFSERLNAVPSRISSGSIPGLSVETFLEDSRTWKKHVNAYKRINNDGLESRVIGKHPNLLLPDISFLKANILAVFRIRSLSALFYWGIFAFLFCCNHCRCNMEDILLEMDRILRPEGAVIFRDKVDVLIKVRRIVGGMRWNAKMVDHEDGPLLSEKVLFTVKQYWVAGENNSTSSQ